MLRERVTVQDNGYGISEKFLPRIYEPFSQERTRETSYIGGSGLGLSIVKGLVDMMHGTIKVESKLGKGTTFVVSYTLERVGNAINNKDDIFDLSNLTGKRILLCEDNAMNQEIAIAVLNKKDMLVETAGNGEEGLEKYLSHPAYYYDAILMDLRMPVMNGYEATQAIRSSEKEDAHRIPIIALSADAYNEDIERSLAYGMNNHLAKPIDPQSLYKELSICMKLKI